MKISILLSVILLSISFNTIKAQNFNEVNMVISPHRDSLGGFGRFVDISGNYAIVGADAETTDTNNLNSMYLPGAAYIYEKGSNGNWVLAQKIIASDRADGDFFGSSVAIYGNYAVVGSVCQDYNAVGNNVIVNAGAVYIFERNNNGKWLEVQKIVSNDRNHEDWFGGVVDISEDYILVGARGDDYNALDTNYKAGSGSVYFFKRDNNNIWFQFQKKVASDRSPNAQFGIAVSIDRNQAIIGAASDSLDALGGNTSIQSGSAYFFELNSSGSWVEITKVTASDSEEDALFGYSVSIYGDKAVIGAYHQGSGPWSVPVNGLYMAGAAYVFEKGTAGAWSQTQKIVASTRHSSDCFGKSVSIDSNTIIVSCFGDDYNAVGGSILPGSGAAYVFKKNNVGSWNQSQKLVASNRQIQDGFGSAVSISGNNIIISAFGRDLDINNTNYIEKSGAAYFFSTDSVIINGLSNISAIAKPQVYPNPTTDKVTIDLGKDYDKIDIRIMDIIGRTLNEYSFENRNSINLDLQQISGIYLIEVKMANKQFVFKIIKE